VRRLQAGIVRYRSIAKAIADALGHEPAPECRVGLGRITVTFRQAGASRWTEKRQIDHALEVAAITRAVLAADSRATIRERADRAIEVIYEDVTVARGCSVSTRYECVVPAAATARFRSTDA
jgi:hypothetical protein